MKTPTLLQRKVLAYCQRQAKFPSPPQIAAHFGWASDNTARAHLKALERKGKLKRGRDKKLSVA